MDHFLCQGQIKPIVRLINNHEILIMPTDTIYGFSCSIFALKQAQKINDWKHRSQSQPMIVLVSSLRQAKLVIQMTKEIVLLIKTAIRNWQPLTVVNYKNFYSPYAPYVSATDIASVRVVGNRWLKKILRRTGPVFSTSVNISGEPPITGPDQALQFLPHHLIVRDDFKAMTNQPSRIFNAITGKYLR